MDNINWAASLVATALLYAVVYFAAAGITCFARPSKDTWYSTQDYLRASGLDINKTYHLRLGSASNGGDVGQFRTSTSTDFFLFAGDSTTTTSSQILPSSSLRLGFHTGNSSYILEEPYSKVIFHQKPGVQASVRFEIYNYWEDKFSIHNVGANYWTFNTGRLADVEPDIRQTNFWYHVQDIGLPTYLGRHLKRIIFTVTPQQYSAYLGTLQVPK